MRVASLHTYPVKSCHRVDQDRAEVQPWGLAGDRRWMVVDPDGRQVTQREAPDLTGVRPEHRTDGGVTLRYPGLADLAVPSPPPGVLQDVSIWGDTVRTGAWYDGQSRAAFPVPL